MGDWYLQTDPVNPGQTVWVYDRNAPDAGPAPTSMLPAVNPSPRPRVEIREDESIRLYPSGQDDLSHLDESAGELVSTEKLGPLDEVLVQPSQDPSWRPDGAA